MYECIKLDLDLSKNCYLTRVKYTSLIHKCIRKASTVQKKST